ncbi:hypothetical protein MM213_15785 [Belliella sp. R4-6]|uniref:Uncharacterized protein n=1 Tax=Belliella alkalica TaxID=1730871 RepID=A0ABS9VEU3_9BACT|nr:hypothetical protein [Belliella alkalica]MCH7414962.1 hypothetical protein [Belliella alkalica]
MGFIPIFLTLGGAVLLFIMVVRQSLKSKKKQFDTLCVATWTGLSQISPEASGETPSFEKINNLYKKAKSELKDDQLGFYNSQIKKPIQEAKLIRIHYNNLVAKRPYSFVAKIFNIQPI